VNRRIAIASCEPLLPDGDQGDLPLVTALRSRGVAVSVHAWSDPAVDWSAYDATVIRSTWDYTGRRQDFLDWLDRVPRLHNPASVVAPNTDKTYLHELSAVGLPVVPTEFAGPTESVAVPSQGQFVIKPTVGAGSRGAGRFDAAQPGELERAQAHAAELQLAGLTVMVQPYLSGVDTAGESALIYLDGVFSHSVRKGRMLGKGDQHGVDGPALYIEENISAREPTDDERAVAERILGHLTAAGGGPLLYARIDLLPSDAGPVLVEAELTEPSLFLDHADGAGERLAAALLDRIA
jgi:hypothetical protein